MSRTRKDQPAWNRTVAVAERGTAFHRCHGADCDIDAVPSPTRHELCWYQQITHPYQVFGGRGVTKAERKIWHWAPERQQSHSLMRKLRRQSSRGFDVDDTRVQARDHRHDLTEHN